MLIAFRTNLEQEDREFTTNKLADGSVYGKTKNVYCGLHCDSDCPGVTYNGGFSITINANPPKGEYMVAPTTSERVFTEKLNPNGYKWSALSDDDTTIALDVLDYPGKPIGYGHRLQHAKRGSVTDGEISTAIARGFLIHKDNRRREEHRFDIYQRECKGQ